MKKHWVPLMVAATLPLSGCGGGGCTTDVRSAIHLVLIAEGATAEALCHAQVIAQNEEGYVAFASGGQGMTGEGDLPGCHFYLADETSGTYTVQIQVQDYQPLTLSDVEVHADACHVRTVTLTETLAPDSNNCHDGYEWVDNTCKTVNGCEFPRLERAIVPGVEGGQVSYECVDRCEAMGQWFLAWPEAPGRCAALALP